MKEIMIWLDLFKNVIKNNYNFKNKISVTFSLLLQKSKFSLKIK